MFCQRCLKTSLILTLIFVLNLFARDAVDVAARLEKVKLAVVSVQSFLTNNKQVQSRVGSGFIYHEDGYIITSQNVVHSADSIVVSLANGTCQRAWPLPNDKQSSLALLKIPGRYQSVVLNEHALTKERINYILGNSLGIFPSLGIVEIGDIWDNGLIDVQLSAFAGNSGAPLVNGFGEVIGMFLGVYSSNKHASLTQKGLALGVDQMKRDAQYIFDRSKNIKSWIGISAIDVGRGVEVVSIIPDSPAYDVHIAPGDTIVAFNGKPIFNTRDLANEVQQVNPEQHVDLDIKRGRVVKKTLKVDMSPWKKQP